MCAWLAAPQYLRRLLRSEPNPLLPTFSVRSAGTEDIGALVLLIHEFYSESGSGLDHGWDETSFQSMLASPHWARCGLRMLASSQWGMRCCRSATQWSLVD